MAREATRVQILLARLAFVLVMAFAVAGLLLYGMSGEVWNRIVGSVAARPGGPMTFRFILQPVMAASLAAIDGIRDARSGAPPYLWSFLAGSRQSVARLHDGVIATSRVILLGLGMDVIYQAIEFDTFFPGEAAIVAVLLGFIPYLVLRGPFARLTRLWITRKQDPEQRRRGPLEMS